MPTSYRSLAVARATTTNNRRLAILVAFTAATALLARLEFPASRAGFTLFALWLLATLAYGIVLRGVRTAQSADRVQVIALAGKQSPRLLFGHIRLRRGQFPIEIAQ